MVTLRTPFDDHTFDIHGEPSDRSVIRTIADNDGRYEPEIMRLLHDLLPPDATALDVGANVGTLTLVLSHLLPAGHVYAFEPEPHNLGHLRRNLDCNGARNVTVHPHALSHSRTSTTLSYLTDFAGGAFISDRVAEGTRQTVQTLALDDWTGSVPLERLDVIKLDVEGAELQVLKGAEETLARFRPDLIIECNPVALSRFQGTSVHELYNFVRQRFRTIAYVREAPNLGRIISFDHLRRVLARRGVINLFCTNRRRRPAGRRWSLDLSARRDSRSEAAFGGLPWTALELVFLHWTYNAFRMPPGNFVVEPAYELRFRTTALELRPAASSILEVELHNLSPYWLSSDFRTNPVSVGHEWLDLEGSLICRVIPGSPLPRPAGPRRSVETVPVQIVAPPEPGDYVLRLSLIQDGFAWFSEMDAKLGAMLNVHVT